MKTINRHLWILLVAILSSSCIERYFPDTELNFSPKLVIEGTISNEGGQQEIVISESSPTENPVLIPVSGCQVTVEDDHATNFSFYESSPGHYYGNINPGSMVVGRSYRLRVKTAEGTEYVSSYEELLPCPEVDAVYSELETKQTTEPGVTESGLQFYLDLKGNSSDSRFFRWQLTQTYEYHSTWPLDAWLDWDGRHDLVVPDYSNFVCYKTDQLKDVFVLSTAGFSENNYSRYKLHFVKDQTQVLMYKYSLLVRQYSLSEAAYNYWENLRKNNQETVDLFGKQPGNVKGNIYNVTDPSEVALGYFGVSSVQTKRIIVLPQEGLKFDQVFRCRALVIEVIFPEDRPFYFARDQDKNGEWYVGEAAPECIFCTMQGGTIEKPPYWDK